MVEFIKRTNGRSVTDQSLENLLEGAAKQAHGREDLNVETRFTNYDWQVADNNTLNAALKNRLMATLMYVIDNALTDNEKQLIIRTVAGKEKKTAVARELNLSPGKAIEIIEEGLGKIKIYMELKHFDAETVSDILAA